MTPMQRLVGALIEERAGYPLDAYLADRVAAGESPETIADGINELIGVTAGVNGRTVRRWIERMDGAA